LIVGTPSVAIELLGPPRILRDGAQVGVDTRKATALVARLALDEDRVITRDTAIDLLWPDRPLDNARNSLRRTLSALRSAVGADVIEADRTTIRLSERVVVDVHNATPPDVSDHGHTPDTTCPSCVAPLEASLSAFAGAFMEGFSLRDAPPFDDWMVHTSDHLDRQRAALLARLIDALEAAHRLPEAADAAARLIDQDPLDETAHRRRIALLGRLGNRAAVADQFAECTRVLEEELGVTPLPDTTRLVDEILSGGAPVAPPPRSEATPLVPAGFVGRTTELAALIEALRRRSATLVVGDPGVGKTRLVAEASAVGEAKGTPAIRVPAVGGDASPPFLLIQRILSEASTDFMGTLPERAAPALEIHPDLSDLGLEPVSIPDGPVGRLRILDAVGTALDTLADGSVLVIDDLHLADDDSMAALRHLLSRRRNPWSAVLIGHSTPGVLELGDATDETLRLGPLDAESVGAMVSSHLGEPDDALAKALAERTGGNPFFLEQCLRADDPTTSVPTSVQASVERRLALLDPLAVQVLGAAAVLARPHALEVLRRVSGRSPEEAADAIDDLLAGGFLATDGITFGIAHSIFGEAVLGSLRPARRALLHGRAAEVLGSSDPVDHATVATHLAASGQLPEAAHARWDAAMDALRVRAFAAAEDHLSHAVALGHPESDAIALHLGDLAMWDGRYEEARSHYEHGRSDHLATDRVLRLAALFRRWGRLDDAERMLEGAHGPEAIAERARLALRRGDRSAIPGLVEAVLTDGTPTDPRLGATLLRLKGLADPVLDDALEALDRAAELATSLDDEDLLIAVENARARRLLDSGRATDALEPARAALELAGRIGDRHHLAALHSNLADVLHELGEVEESQSHQRAAVAGFSDVGATQWEPEVWTLTEW
jgi:DNA-binding SARP family transcriptional activator/tetratricopeptide (TPR) repeat protein